MSKILFLAIIAWIALGGSSCKRETLPTYSTTNSIYFENETQSQYRDSSYISFAYASAAATDSTIQLVVSVTGSASNTDRPFKMVASPSSTAVSGTHYEALPETYQFPAHQVHDTITVKLLRSADLKDKEVFLFLDLQENGSFTTRLKDAGFDPAGKPMGLIRYKIFFTDILTMPQGWAYQFGKFSAKKMDIICSLGGVTPSFLNAGDDVFVFPGPFFSIETTYLAELLNNYLTQMAMKGTPVYYEDGVTLMRTDDAD